MFVVIEYMGEPEFLKDEEGKVIMFKFRTDAVDAARDCANGIVVNLSQYRDE